LYFSRLRQQLQDRSMHQGITFLQKNAN
jgi:hypothetical protein